MKKKKLLTDRSNDLFSKIEEQAAQRMADDIDWQLIADLKIASGWSKVVLDPMTWERSYEVDDWVSDNIKGPFDTRGLVWIFKEAREANWFSLRWLS